MYGCVRAFSVQACFYETVLNEARIGYYIYFNFDVSATTIITSDIIVTTIDTTTTTTITTIDIMTAIGTTTTRDIITTIDTT